jgi:hypothetical protein
LQAHRKFDLADIVASDGSKDYIPVYDDEGREVGDRLDHEHISRSKLIVETLMRQAAKIVPRQYGDKVALTGGSKDDGDEPLQVVIGSRESDL